MAALVEHLARVFLPAACALCGGPLPMQGSAAGVCGPCWRRLPLSREPACPRCGGDSGDGNPCLSCRQAPPPWDAAATVGDYEGNLRELILLFKHGGRDELALPLARLLHGRLRQLPWPAPDAVVAVPTWWVRRLRRGFDHAGLLAHHLARRLPAPHVPALRRVRPGSQARLGRSQRLRLPATTFVSRRPLRGHVLLVDDVLTTGATARACTRALLGAGAAAVSLLTLARTPPHGSVP